MKRSLLSLSIITLSILLSSCATHDVVTYSEYSKIKPNMTIEEVEKVVGSKGRIINGEAIDTTIVPTEPGELIYFWENKDKSNISVAILNGKVIHVSAHDLR